MDNNERNKIIKVARMYYEQDQMQGEIAQELNISRPQVSRILKKAKELGIVKINIIDPWGELREIEDEIAKHFKLKKVLVVEAEEGAALQQQLGYSAGQYVAEILKPGDIIGVAWGTTLYQMVTQMPIVKLDNIKVVQIKGGILPRYQEVNAFEIASIMAKKVSGELYYLPLPVVLDTVEAKEILFKEPNIQSIIELGKKANIGIYSIGHTTKDSIISKSGYLTGEQLEVMHEGGAVGDICSRFFRYDGSTYDKELDARTTSIELEQLKEKEYSIGIVGGTDKLEAVLGALNGGYINTLVIDKQTAEKVIESMKDRKS